MLICMFSGVSCPQVVHLLSMKGHTPLSRECVQGQAYPCREQGLSIAQGGAQPARQLTAVQQGESWV